MRTFSARPWVRRALGVATLIAAVGWASGCDFTVGSGSAKLDPGFGGGDGLVTFESQTRRNDSAGLVEFGPDGTVFVTEDGDNGVALTVNRYLADGSLDPSFGDGGVLATDIKAFERMRLVAFGDGSFAVVADIVPPGENGTALRIYRFTAAGEPDPAFGVGGVADASVPPLARSVVLGSAVADGDGIVLTADVPPDPQVPSPRTAKMVRFGADGAPDTAFGPDGTGAVILDANSGDVGGSNLLVRRLDGSFAVVQFSVLQPVQEHRRVLYVSPAGLLTAVVPIPVDTTQMQLLLDGVAAPDGSLYLAGEPLATADTGFIKLAPDGTLDPTFGIGGLVVVPLVTDLSAHLAVTDDGGVLAAGDGFIGGTKTISSTRLTPTGAFFPGYGTNGVASYAPPGPAEAATAVTATPAGATIVGTANVPPLNDTDILMLGITPTGQLDTGFGDGGRAQVDLGLPGEDSFGVVLPLPGGDVFVAGDEGKLGDALVAGRYDADGTPDAAHPPSEVFEGQLDARVPLAGTVAPDGSVFLVVQNNESKPSGSFGSFGGGNPSWRLVKFAPDGSLDTGFGDGGAVVHNEQSYPNGVAVRPDGTILVAWTVVHPLRFDPSGQIIPPTFDFKVGAFTPGGDPDTSFGTGGVLLRPGAGASTPAPDPGESGIRDILAVGPDNQAYVTADGLDRIDPAGTAFTPVAVPPALGKANDVAVDAQGRVLVVGAVSPNGNRAATAVARFDPSLAPDPTFGTGGVAPLPAVQQGSRSVGPLLSAEAGGGVTVVEYQVATGRNYSDLVIRRLLLDGTTDTGFSQDGLAQAALRPGGQTAAVFSAALLGHDILVAGSIGTPMGDHDAFVVRVNGRDPERSLPPQ